MVGITHCERGSKYPLLFPITEESVPEPSWHFLKQRRSQSRVAYSFVISLWTYCTTLRYFINQGHWIVDVAQLQHQNNLRAFQLDAVKKCATRRQLYSRNDKKASREILRLEKWGVQHDNCMQGHTLPYNRITTSTLRNSVILFCWNTVLQCC